MNTVLHNHHRHHSYRNAIHPFSNLFILRSVLYKTYILVRISPRERKILIKIVVIAIVKNMCY